MRRTIVIGDVHGCFEPLQRLLDLIGPSSDDRIISIGDFVDRGPDSPACTAFFMQHEAIMGNHEYKHVRHRKKILWFLSESQVEARAQFPGAGLTYENALDYMDTLPFSIELDEALLVHAGVDYRWPMNRQNRIMLVGGFSQRRMHTIIKREPVWLPRWTAWYPSDAKPLICGHVWWEWPRPAQIPVRENLYPLDTGCVKGVWARGQLTAVSLPDFTVYQVPGRMS